MLSDLVPTADGSCTVKDARTGEHYHSLHGAETESLHVFIQAGLEKAMADFEGPLLVLEVGFGTGLNALLTWQHAVARQRAVEYLALEPFPLAESIIQAYHTPAMDAAWHPAFLSLHGLDPAHSPLREQGLSPKSQKSASAAALQPPLPGFFSCRVLHSPIQTAALPGLIQLVYYDAFSPEHEPALWTDLIWQKLFLLLAPGAVLVTYCAKGSVRRALGEVGFSVERLTGPPFKRHMLRAVKPRHNPS
ncbi:MAG: tRNA (5-methylaminomethyl-2-thiouridine)(34)-methyltransferase MnmD [Bacteroidetes bacterium]|nr:tRNA (5-methylaminomethyl-2-thiouridine)(34)-methyltransferase MnmD [Bacteroidota bacterium]